MPQTIKKIDFEKSYDELEKIVEELESGQLTVDESLKRYERGLALAKALKEKLSAVEQKVETMKKALNDN